MKRAEKQLERAQDLRKSQTVSEEIPDTRVSEVDVLRREPAQHESVSVDLAEVRVVDLEKAEAEVARAWATVQRAEANLDIFDSAIGGREWTPSWKHERSAQSRTPPRR